MDGYLMKPRTMMASIASAVDAITQSFCCHPSYLIQSSTISPISDKPDKSCCERVSDKCVVYSHLHTRKSTVSSKPRQEEVIIHMPSLESESQSCSSVKHHQETITSKEDIDIVDPPPITRVSNPWILLVIDERESAPETCTAKALAKLLQSSRTYHVHKHSTETRRIQNDSFSLLEPVPLLPSTTNK